MEVSELTKRRIIEYLNEGKRFDNREMLEYRPILIETGISKNAEGSSRVKIGNTEVVVGVKVDLAEPYTDSPEEGAMMVTAEFNPLASDKFESGPPSAAAIELARIVDRGIRESGFIDFKKLCIKKGEAVWCIFIDIYPINHDGNLIDAAALAAVAALKSAVFPEYNKEENKVLYGELTNKKLPLSESMPLTMTFHKIGSNLVLDPVLEEEEAADARLSIAFSKSEKKKDLTINAIQKGGAASLSDEEIDNILENSVKIWNQFNDIIENLDLKKK